MGAAIALAATVGCGDDGGGGSGGETASATEGAKAIDVAAMEGAKGHVEFPASADEQRNQFVQRQEAKSADCDVFRSDVIWTAEFASQGWLYDLTPYMDEVRDRFIPSSLETATFEDKIWGVPSYTNAALLYYRSDRVDAVPATWQELYAQAGSEGGIVFQGAACEGLTCDWLSWRTRPAGRCSPRTAARR